MLTNLQKRKFTRLFELYDSENKGFIDRDTFTRLVKDLALERGWLYSDTEYDLLWNKWMNFWETIYRYGDMDENNRLTISEFLIAFDYIINEMKDSFERVLIQVPYYLFQVHDTNQDGVISKEEYKSFLTSIGSGLDEETIDRLFLKIDLDGNKVITKDEFNKIVHQFYFSDDEEDAGNYLYGRF